MPLKRTEASPERVEEIFRLVWEAPPEQRPALMAELCGDHTALHDLVACLMTSAAEAELSAGWNQSAIENEAGALASEEGGALDRYNLLEMIGAGGMGVVYRAARADDSFSKLVAVKIVHAGATDPDVLRRFLQERQILAGLEHPHIARLLDGGATKDGLPFLVMEFVDGVPLDRYVAAHKLPDEKADLTQRLNLMRKICGAVSYAHRNLVVHRDLKPGNVLVTGDGEPKLLDFGIARLLSGGAVRTRTEASGMTPEYASPEQIQGGVIGTASDVYSLGVLLYETLTGASPYGRTLGALELAQAIATTAPSSLETAGGRRYDVDLETIIRKALRKEPERRYTSVDEFAEDIRRYQEGFPVTAIPDTTGYRARKFVLRNRGAVGAGAVAAVLLVAGVAAIWRQAQISERRFNDVRRLANSYLFEFHDAIKDLPGATPARQLVMKRAVEFLDGLAAERANNTELGRELATAYDKIGDIQGNVNAASMGNQRGALALYQKALAIRQRLHGGSPSNRDVARELAVSYALVGWQRAYLGDPSAAAADLRQAVALGETVLAAMPGEPLMRETQAANYASLADVLGNSSNQNLGDSKGAILLYRKSLAIREGLVKDAPANATRLENLAVSSSRLSQLLQTLDDKAGAIAAATRAADIFDEMLGRAPGNADYRRSAALANRNLALSLVKVSSFDEARRRGDRSTQILEQVSKDDPGNVQARIEVADGYYAQGFIRAGANDNAEARRFYEAAIGIQEKLRAEHPGEVPRPGLRTAYQLLADLNVKTGDAARAIASAQQELRIDEWLLQADKNNAGAQRNQGLAWRQIGQAHELNGMSEKAAKASRMAEFGEARQWYAKSLALFQKQKAAGTMVPSYAGELEKTPVAIARCERVMATLRDR